MKNLILAAAVTLYSATALAVPCPKCGTDVPGLIPIVVPPVTPESLGPQVTPQSLAALTIAQPQCPSAEPAKPADDASRQKIKEYMRKLMDETRTLANGEQRGSAGSYAKLAGPQVEEFVTAIIDGARFMPKQLKDEEKWALICAQISIESAFTPGTRGVNPGDGRMVSVSPLQITVRSTPQGPGMWEDIMRKYCKEDLKHYDGSKWDVPNTDPSALEHSIYDGITASLWCITEQGRRGCPEWLGGPDGPAPKTMRTAFLGWVLGCPCVVNGTDLASQREKYEFSIRKDLEILGFDPNLFDAPF